MADKNIKAAPGQATSPAPASDNITPALRAAGGKAPALKAEGKAAAAEPKDNVREIIETVVFVVVLVLLLKSFAAEAFVIPTGSMAETLWGYQRVAKCPQCGFETPVNYSKEVDPQGGPPEQITGYTCPNCRYHQTFSDTDWNSGDRVLVAKFLYDAPLWVLGLLILGVLLVYLFEKTPLWSLLRAQQIPRGGWVRIGLCMLLLLGLVGVSLAMPLTQPPAEPHRLDVVVFKYPNMPEQKRVPTNYIKRLIGQPGETIGIYYGKLYVLYGLKYDEPGVDPLNLWRIQYMHMGDLDTLLKHEKEFQQLFDVVVQAGQTVEFKRFRELRVTVNYFALQETADQRADRERTETPEEQARREKFEDLIGKLRERLLQDEKVGRFRTLLESEHEAKRLLALMVIHQDELRALRDRGDLKFHIIRKPPAQLLAMRRIVYDNDHPAADLSDQPQRWAGADDGGAWGDAAPNGFQHAGSETDKQHWLRYHHRLRQPGTTRVGEPQLITDFMGYNAYETPAEPDRRQTLDWAGDLMLECEVTIEQAQGELVLQLSKGIERFEARWDLASGECSLWRVQTVKPDGTEEKRPMPTALGQANTWMSKPGTYQLRFANADERLVVWVDGKLVFGEGVAYDAPDQRGPMEANDLEPASIGVRKAGVKVHHMKLWRDTYYTTQHGTFSDASDGESSPQVDWGDPSKWDSLRKLAPLTMYVQPGHYLCMGDNSPESSDSRYWGAVPERLLLGRALLIYWPVSRVGRIE
jgi:signal peptidase I